MTHPLGQALLMIGGGFTPLSISGCVAWYDASDTSTISHSSNAVTQWRDKSTSAFNLAPNLSSERPLTNTDSQNGRNVVKFDGSDDEVFIDTAAILKNVGGWSLFGVAKTTTNTSVNNQNIFTVLTGGSPTLTRAAITVRNGNPNSAELFSTARRLDADAATNVGLGGSAVGTSWFYASFVGNFATTTGTLYKNGSQIATSSSWCSSGNSSNTNGQIAIGAFYGNGVTPSSYWTGDVAEVIIYNSALSTANRQTVEAYLANKWGL